MRRALFALLVVAGVTILTFVLIHLAPGDPVYLLAGDGGSPAYYDEMRARYGLDRPLAEQLRRYLSAITTLELGYSFMFQAPVAKVLLEHAPASLLLGTTALLLGTALGLLAGLVCVTARSGGVDGTVRGLASALYAAPVFWTGQVLIILLAVRAGAFPAGGMTSARESLTGLGWTTNVLWHLALPAFTLSLPLAAVVARVTRAAMLDVMREPFVLASAARGFSRLRLLLRHIAPNAMVPVVTLIGQYAGQMAAGAALVEALFGWPGLGYLVLHASLHRDYPLVTAAFIGISASVVSFNALTDAVCAWLDPRIRLS
ncbi:MAG: ABC transporter permease [Acidobacteria bacterium]|nr:ABC transporter permease [Acidobacteriota bacterium]